MQSQVEQTAAGSIKTATQARRGMVLLRISGSTSERELDTGPLSLEQLKGSLRRLASSGIKIAGTLH